MTDVYDLSQIDGDVHTMHPQTCPATCMLAMCECMHFILRSAVTSRRPAASSDPRLRAARHRLLDED